MSEDRRLDEIQTRADQPWNRSLELAADIDWLLSELRRVSDAQRQSEHEQTEAYQALHDHGGVELKGGLASSIAMSLKAMNATRVALIQRAEQAESALASIRAALADAGIQDEHSKLVWTFVPHQVEVTAGGGDERTRLADLFRQVRYLIDDLVRQRDAALAASSAGTEGR